MTAVKLPAAELEAYRAAKAKVAELGNMARSGPPELPEARAELIAARQRLAEAELEAQLETQLDGDPDSPAATAAAEAVEQARQEVEEASRRVEQMERVSQGARQLQTKARERVASTRRDLQQATAREIGPRWHEAHQELLDLIFNQLAPLVAEIDAIADTCSLHDAGPPHPKLTGPVRDAIDLQTHGVIQGQLFELVKAAAQFGYRIYGEPVDPDLTSKFVIEVRERNFAPPRKKKASKDPSDKAADAAAAEE